MFHVEHLWESSAGDVAEEVEEGLFAFGVDAPVDGGALVAVGVVAGTGVEVAPGSVFGEGGGEVVLGFVEVEVIIFIKEDGHGAVAGDGAGFADHGGDAVGILDAVAVDEEEVGGFDDVLAGDAVASVGGAGEEAAALAVDAFD